MSTTAKSTKPRKATKPSQIDYHGFVAAKVKKDTGNWGLNWGITDTRASEITNLLRKWAPNPAKFDIPTVTNNIAGLSTENDRLFAAYILGQTVTMAGMMGAAGGEDSSDASDSLDSEGLGDDFLNDGDAN